VARHLGAVLAALHSRPLAVVRDRDALVIGVDPDAVVVANGADGFAALDHAERGGFWIGLLSYDLGRAVERVAPRAAADLECPDVVLARFDARLVLRDDGAAEIIGAGPARATLADALRGRAASCAAPPERGSWTTSMDRAQHAAGVHTIKQLLASGECYQVNLTRRLTLPESVDAVALFLAVDERHRAPHEALVAVSAAHASTHVLPTVVSASPELFLRIDGRTVETRPIKGTAVDPNALHASAKDRAENVMIVDLARNDLGRVCVPGSISVPALCAIEAHPGLHHLVSTVRGERRRDVSLGALMRAMFPAASITGAPKPRVMQVIEDLEPVRRGFYCGSVGWLDADRGVGEWSVAIRTFVVTPNAVHLGVGGGIVADSEAQAEWDETELKATRLREVVRSARGGVPMREREIVAGGRA
jgi:para-aminobenzoate synthetase component 1